MEALLAVGLASNVVQFADFASRLVASARNLYLSANGKSAPNEELELLTRNLRALAETENLKQLAKNTQFDSFIPSSTALGSGDAKVWKQLSLQCRILADELLELLKSLEVKGNHASIESVYRALRTVWKTRPY
jgi:hypothetical protein